MTARTNNTEWTARDELEWLAFRYAANELTAEESRAFEARLAEDEAAQRTLARTVQMTHALVSIIEPETAVPALHRHGRVGRGQTRFVALASAVAVIAVCSAFLVGRFFPGVSRDEAASTGAALQVAAGGNTASAGSQATHKPLSDDVVVRMVDTWSKLEWALNSESATAEGTASGEMTRGESSVLGADTADDGEFDWVVAALNESENIPLLNGKEKQ